MKKRKKILLLVVLLLVLSALVLFAFLYGTEQETGGAGTAVSGNQTTGADTTITLSQDHTVIDGTGAKLSGSTVTITNAGTYSITGSLSEGKLCVDADSSEDVILVLNGVSITNSEENAIQVENAGHTTLWLQQDSENYVQSGVEKEIVTDRQEEETGDATGGAVYAGDDLTIAGTGSLTVYGYLNNGIQTADALVIESGSIRVSAVNHGLKGKDSVDVTGGNITVLSGQDGIQSDGTVHIQDGSVSIASGDDGIHADLSLLIEGGTIEVTESVEGLEANQVEITGGEISVTSSDDGINANGGETGSTQTSAEGKPRLNISGGTVFVDAQGDGLDSNGDLVIDGGLVIVEGPTDRGNGAIDAGTENGGTCLVNGGTVLAVGSAGMAEGFDEASEQCSFLHNFDSTLAAGVKIKVLSQDGSVLYEYTPRKEFSSIIFSSADLVQGSSAVLQAGEESVEIELDSNAVHSGNAGRGGGMGKPDGNGGPGGRQKTGEPGERKPGGEPGETGAPGEMGSPGQEDEPEQTDGV